MGVITFLLDISTHPPKKPLPELHSAICTFTLRALQYIHTHKHLKNFLGAHEELVWPVKQETQLRFPLLPTHIDRLMCVPIKIGLMLVPFITHYVTQTKHTHTYRMEC